MKAIGMENHCRRVARSCEPGFTLTELLVTIAIIAILASLLGTGLARARDSARKSQCVQNLKQQGTALASFVQSYHVYPYYMTPPEKQAAYPEHRTFWATAIGEGRIKGFSDNDTGIFRCPSAVRPKDWPAHEVFVSYGYNDHGMVSGSGEGNLGLGGAGTPDGSDVRPVMESEVINPAAMLAIGDGVVGNKNGLNDGLASISRTARPLIKASSEARIMRRHNKSLQMLFCDGHVDSILVTRLFKDEDQPALAAWNRDNLVHAERLN